MADNSHILQVQNIRKNINTLDEPSAFFEKILHFNKMSAVKKCSYSNVGSCKFSRKENGCKLYHPEECCQLINCIDRDCPKSPSEHASLVKNDFFKRTVRISMSLVIWLT